MTHLIAELMIQSEASKTFPSPGQRSKVTEFVMIHPVYLGMPEMSCFHDNRLSSAVASDWG